MTTLTGVLNVKEMSTSVACTVHYMLRESAAAPADLLAILDAVAVSDNAACNDLLVATVEQLMNLKDESVEKWLSQSQLLKHLTARGKVKISSR